jgi:hypothetical protein
MYAVDILVAALLACFIYILIFGNDHCEEPRFKYIVKRTNDAIDLLEKIEKQEELVYYTRLFRWNSKLIGD